MIGQEALLAYDHHFSRTPCFSHSVLNLFFRLEPAFLFVNIFFYFIFCFIFQEDHSMIFEAQP